MTTPSTFRTHWVRAALALALGVTVIGQIAYAASKAGLIQLTRSLSEELRPFHIRVNGIDPGLMDTDLGAEIRSMGPSILGEDLYRTMADYKEKSVLKDPADVAELAVFLASGRSAGLSGHIGTMRYYRDQGYKA